MKGICRSGAQVEDLDGLKQLALAAKRAASSGRLDGRGVRMFSRSEEIPSQLDAMRTRQTGSRRHRYSEIRPGLLDGAGFPPGNVIGAALPQGGHGLEGPRLDSMDFGNDGNS